MDPSHSFRYPRWASCDLRSAPFHPCLGATQYMQSPCPGPWDPPSGPLSWWGCRPGPSYMSVNGGPTTVLVLSGLPFSPPRHTFLGFGRANVPASFFFLGAFYVVFFLYLGWSASGSWQWLWPVVGLSSPCESSPLSDRAMWGLVGNWGLAALPGSVTYSETQNTSSRYDNCNINLRQIQYQIKTNTISSKERYSIILRQTQKIE